MKIKIVFLVKMAVLISALGVCDAASAAKSKDNPQTIIDQQKQVIDSLMGVCAVYEKMLDKGLTSSSASSSNSKIDSLQKLNSELTNKVMKLKEELAEEQKKESKLIHRLDSTIKDNQRIQFDKEDIIIRYCNRCLYVPYKEQDVKKAKDKIGEVKLQENLSEKEYIERLLNYYAEANEEMLKLLKSFREKKENEVKKEGFFSSEALSSFNAECKKAILDMKYYKLYYVNKKKPYSSIVFLNMVVDNALYEIEHHEKKSSSIFNSLISLMESNR